jgi:parvulin-like peptidyl-prolyl isomerase
MKTTPRIGIVRALCVALATLLATGCQAGLRIADKTPAQSQGSEQAGHADNDEAKHIIVAKVNGADITMYSLTSMMDRMAAIDRDTSASASAEETRKKALDQLIFQELSLQEALRQGVRVKETEIESAITTLVGHDTQDFEKFLAKQNMTAEEVRSEIKRRILLQRIYVREVIEKISVTDDDVRKEFERRKNEYIAPDKAAAREKQASYEEVKGFLKEKLRDEEQIKRFQAWELELKNSAKIEMLHIPERPQQRKP